MPTKTKPTSNAKPQANGKAPTGDLAGPDARPSPAAAPDETANASIDALLGTETTRLITEIMTGLKATNPRARLRFAEKHTGERPAFDEHTCKLTGYGFSLAAGSPVPTITFAYRRGDDCGEDTIVVHPGLFAGGEAALREALADAIDHFRGEAALLLARCAEFEMLLQDLGGAGLPLDWPDYWLDPTACPPRGEIWQGLRGVVHRGWAGLRI